MLRSFVVALSVLVLSACVSLPSPVPHQTFSDIRASTVLVTMDNGSCSGVVISPVKVLTAAHCDGPNMKVDGVPAVVVKKNAAADVMLLITLTKKPALEVAKSRPALDDLVVLSGYPLGVGLVLTQGRVQELLIEDLPHHMLISAPGIFGNSGGPAVAFNFETGKYEVVGIASMLAVAGGFFPITHLVFVVNTETINKFLE